MRILVVQESDWVKRGPHQQHHLFERLYELGHEIRVIDYEVDWKENKSYKPFSRSRNFDVPGKVLDSVLFKIERPFLIRAPILCYVSILIVHTLKIVKMIKSFKPDVIIGMGVLNANLSSRLAKLFGIPFVYYLIDCLHTLIPEKHFQPFGRYIESRTLKRADQVLAINKHLGKYAKKLGAIGEPEIITAGIDKTRFNPDVDGTGIRRELKIQDDKIVIFFMGWLYDFSGLREVAQSVSETSSNVRLLVLGRGDLQEELKDLSAKGQCNKITVIDWVSYEEVPRYVSAADICILPAHLNEIMRDIVPIKLYEYLACGKPVITTKLPGIMKEFGHNCGIVYVDSPEIVIEKAEMISNDEKLYSDLSQAALRFSESLDWEEITDNFLQLLENLVNKK